MNTYRLYLFGADGAVEQVSEIECPSDDDASAFAAERRRDHAAAELRQGERVVVRLGPSGPRPPAVQEAPATALRLH